MTRVEIYTKFGCPYCARAKALLGQKGVAYEEYEINAVRGKQLYYDYSCYGCHGFNGETGARAFVPNWPANLATESSFMAFLRGRANQAPMQPSTGMPNYAKETLNDAQAKDIYAYIRTFKSNAAPADKIPTLNAILSAAQKAGKP